MSTAVAFIVVVTALAGVVVLLVGVAFAIQELRLRERLRQAVERGTETAERAAALAAGEREGVAAASLPDASEFAKALAELAKALQSLSRSMQAFFLATLLFFVSGAIALGHQIVE